MSEERWQCSRRKCSWTGLDNQKAIEWQGNFDDGSRRGIVKCPRCGNIAFSRLKLSGKYFLYSVKWSKGIATWWGPDSKGYVDDITRAGKYSEEEAFAIGKGIHGDAVPIPVEEVKSFVTRTIIDQGDWDNSARLKEMLERFGGNLK